MKNILKQSIQFLGMPIVLLALTANYSHGAVTNAVTNAAPEEAAAPKSVFQDDLKNGKDPFFPRSARRAEKVVAADTQIIAPIVQLSLKGISGPANRRLALINNQTLSAGETAYVRIASGQVKVRCLEIRENSVIISIEGDTKEKELRLRSGL